MQINSASKISAIVLLRKLWGFLLPYKLKIILVFIALSITSTSVLVLGYALRLLIDNGFSAGNIFELKKIFLSLIVLIITLSIATFIRASTINVVCESAEVDIRNKVYAHIVEMSPEFFEMNKTSDVISRMTVDTAVLNSVIANVLSFLVRNSLMLVGGITMLFTISIKLTLTVFTVLPIVIIPILVFSKKIRAYSRQVQEMTSLLSSHIEETLNGIKTVQSFNLEEFEKQNFTKLVRDTFIISKARHKKRALLIAMMIGLSLIAIAFVLWVGSNYVINQEISAGSLSSFIFYSIMVAASIGGIGEVVGDLQRSYASCERIFELLEIKSNIPFVQPIKLPKDFKYNIECKDLSFFYPARPDAKVLDEVNFTIKESETVAIVGSSGSGKTTIFNLLLHFYNISSGQILIGGIDVNKFNLKQLRDFFAYVPQEPVIFSASAFDNIRYGKPSATMEEVVKAAKAAEIEQFLNSLPNGFNTFLGEKGVRISGGQRQRIAIARAILKDPKILLLDEATSSLDNENEKLVKKALDRLKKGRTTIIIAHRFSTIADADNIILLNLGKISAIGNYNYLLEHSELFSKLANTSY